MDIELTPEQAEEHRVRILKMQERIAYLNSQFFVWLLITLLNALVTIGFASMHAPHIARAFLTGLFLCITIISAITTYRTRRAWSHLVDLHFIEMYRRHE